MRTFNQLKPGDTIGMITLQEGNVPTSLTPVIVSSVAAVSSCPNDPFTMVVLITSAGHQVIIYDLSLLNKSVILLDNHIWISESNFTIQNTSTSPDYSKHQFDYVEFE